MSGGVCRECQGMGFKKDGSTPCPRCNAGAAPRPRLSPTVQAVIRNQGTPALTDLQGWQEKYGKSVGETVRLLVEVGVPEGQAADAICTEYVRAGQANDGSVGRETWVEVGLQMLRDLHAAKKAEVE